MCAVGEVNSSLSNVAAWQKRVCGQAEAPHREGEGEGEGVRVVSERGSEGALPSH